MIKIKLVLFKGKKLSDKRHPIMIRVTDSGISKYISTGFSAYPKEWDDSARTFKNVYKKNCQLTQPQFDLQTATLAQKLNDARNDLLEIQRGKQRISLDEVVNKIRNIETFVYFSSYTEKIIKENRNTGKLGNAEIYNSVLSAVKEFQVDKELLLHDINYKWLKEFETWNLSKEIAINSLSVYMRTIRAILNRAIAEGKLDAGLYPFRKYKIQSSPTRKRAISKET